MFRSISSTRPMFGSPNAGTVSKSPKNRTGGCGAPAVSLRLAILLTKSRATARAPAEPHHVDRLAGFPELLQVVIGGVHPFAPAGAERAADGTSDEAKAGADTRGVELALVWFVGQFEELANIGVALVEFLIRVPRSVKCV